MLRVVVFTGGRGSSVLSRRLLQHPDVHVVFAINGYDDGASTGEVRRFLGNALGPSDFRKNASRVAESTRSCSADLIALLDARLPQAIDGEHAVRDLTDLQDGHHATDLPAFTLEPHEQRGVSDHLAAFLDCWR